MFMCCKKSCEAKVANGALVVSFLDADLPKVWRADLSHVASASFELREQQGKFRLVMTRAGADAEEIAVFSDKARAVKTLEKLTRALMSSEAGGGKTGFFRKLTKVVFWIIGIFFVLVILSFVVGPKPAGQQMQTPAVKTGVPVPFDEAFGK